MDYKEYIKEMDRLYCVGNTTEHSFRGRCRITSNRYCMVLS